MSQITKQKKIEKRTKRQMVLYIADRKMNDRMERLDQKPVYKWFVTIYDAEIPLPMDITIEEILQRAQGIVEESKLADDIFIPAVSINGHLYSDPEVRVLSDGKREWFLDTKSNTYLQA